jgi:hypothetical protein
MRVTSLAPATALLVLGIATSAHAVTFSNQTAIAIPAGAPAVTDGKSDRSDIAVSGVTGRVTKVTATFHGFAHNFPPDVDALLVGPRGQASYLMSDAGDTSAATRTLELTFDDSATQMPCLDSTGFLGSGTWAPTDDPLTGLNDCSDPNRPDEFAAPAPAGPWGAKLSAFDGVDPNGTWSLYVTDDSSGDSGSLAGWSLDLTIAPPTVGAPSIAGAPAVGKTLTANGGPIEGDGSPAYRWSRCDLAGAGCAAIAGAETDTYVPTADDRGHTLVVSETATNSGGSDSATSAPTAPVGPAILSTAGTRKTQRVLRQRGVIAYATSNIAAGVVARATITIPGASKVYRLRPARRQLGAGATTKLKLALSRRGLKAIRPALTHRASLKATLTLTVTDPSGGTASRKLSIRLKR